MQRRRVSSGVIGMLVIVFGSATSAFAQDKGKIGLTMGYPSSVGIVYHVTDKLAVRPELTIAQASTEATGPAISRVNFSASSSSWAIGTGVSALFYVRQWDDLHLYVSPRWTYSHGSSSSDTLSVDSTLNSWSLNGSVGAQYALGKRFGVFGEVGFGYQHSHQKSGGSPIQAEITGHGIGTRTGVGVILCF